MSSAKVKLDLKGLGEVAMSAEMHRAVKDLAETVADNVRSQGIRVDDIPGDIALPVEVSEPRNTKGMRYFNRARVDVTLAHESGLAVQAKDGALTKATSAAGIKIKPFSDSPE